MKRAVGCREAVTVFETPVAAYVAALLEAVKDNSPIFHSLSYGDAARPGAYDAYFWRHISTNILRFCRQSSIASYKFQLEGQPVDGAVVGAI